MSCSVPELSGGPLRSVWPEHTRQASTAGAGARQPQQWLAVPPTQRQATWPQLHCYPCSMQLQTVALLIAAAWASIEHSASLWLCSPCRLRSAACCLQAGRISRLCLWACYCCMTPRCLQVHRVNAQAQDRKKGGAHAACAVPCRRPLAAGSQPLALQHSCLIVQVPTRPRVAWVGLLALRKRCQRLPALPAARAGSDRGVCRCHDLCMS